jgi:transposase
MTTRPESPDDRRRRERALALLREGQPVIQIARKVARHRSTVYRWRDELVAVRSVAADR